MSWMRMALWLLLMSWLLWPGEQPLHLALVEWCPALSSSSSLCEHGAFDHIIAYVNWDVKQVGLSLKCGSPGPLD